MRQSNVGDTADHRQACSWELNNFDVHAAGAALEFHFAP